MVYTLLGGEESRDIASFTDKYSTLLPVRAISSQDSHWGGRSVKTIQSVNSPHKRERDSIKRQKVPSAFSC